MLDSRHVAAENGRRDDRQIAQPQVLEPAEAKDGTGNPVVRLRNDGRPFSLRAAPNHYTYETARLYPLARSVELLGRCSRRWCYVRYGNAAGWLSTDRFLRDPSGSPAFLSSYIHSGDTENNARSDVAAPAAPVTIETVAPVRQLADIALPVRRSSVLPPLPTFQVASIPQSAQLKLSRIEQKNYAIKELGSKLFLRVHEERAEASRILGSIPFFAADVEALGLCVEDWCLVRRGSLQGWIRRHHLTDELFVVGPRLQLEPVMPVEALKIYSAPNEDAKLIANIASPVTNIRPLERCNEQWCQVRYSNIAGWVQPTYLTRQR